MIGWPSGKLSRRVSGGSGDCAVDRSGAQRGRRYHAPVSAPTTEEPREATAPPAAPPTAEEPDRRGDERREGERRRFRFGFGRRDAGARRGADRPARRLTTLVLAVGSVAVLSLAARFTLVAPARFARVEAATISTLAAPRFAQIAFPLQAVVGFAPPVGGDPAHGAALDPAARDVLTEWAERLDRATTAAPGEVAPYVILGDVRLALGDESLARRAYYEAVALGGREVGDRARVALAALTLRTAFRSTDEQDRAFAAETALLLLADLDAAGQIGSACLVERALGELILGLPDLDATLFALTARDDAVAKAALPLLQARRSERVPEAASTPAPVDPPTSDE